MHDDKLDRVRRAVEKFSRRNQPGKPKRKNKSPEKEVVKEILTWLNANDFDVHVVESKAVYSVSAGRYLAGQTDPGMSDIVGCTPEGVACFIEVKAKGRLNNLSLIQQKFLISKAQRGCFAVNTDSVERIKVIYDHWLRARKRDVDFSNKYLIGIINQE